MHHEMLLPVAKVAKIERKNKIIWKNLIFPVKRLHRRLPLLIDALRLHELLKRGGNHLQVRLQRHMIHIPDIEFELLRPTEVISSMTLRPARDPGRTSCRRACSGEYSGRYSGSSGELSSTKNSATQKSKNL